MRLSVVQVWIIDQVDHKQWILDEYWISTVS